MISFAYSCMRNIEWFLFFSFSNTNVRTFCCIFVCIFDEWKYEQKPWTVSIHSMFVVLLFLLFNFCERCFFFLCFLRSFHMYEYDAAWLMITHLLINSMHLSIQLIKRYILMEFLLFCESSNYFYNNFYRKMTWSQR